MDKKNIKSKNVRDILMNKSISNKMLEWILMKKEKKGAKAQN